MGKLNQIGIMALVFTAGCFTASVVKQISVPALHANSTAMKWEQTCVSSQQVGARGGVLGDQEAKGWDDVVKEWGAQGWELIDTVTSHSMIRAACFKRSM